MSRMMKAVVIHEPGPAEVLKIEERPVPVPNDGWVLIEVKAFGINRSELFTRRGHSTAVKFPRILGIEAVGVVVEAPGSNYESGQTVATAMGGLGRQFDGSYAEFTCVPASQIVPIDSTLDYSVLGALPEMIQTAWGSLHRSLHLEPGHTLLIRGGTTSVGLAAAILAKKYGASVIATTRKPERIQFLKDNAADYVFVDSGSIAEDVRRDFPAGVDRVLELVGTTTLLDSLKTAGHHGIVCMTGMVGNKWQLDNFDPMDAIPTSVKLTTYAGESEDFINTPLQSFINELQLGNTQIKVGNVFKLDQIVEAHRCMEENRANGKIVVVT